MISIGIDVSKEKSMVCMLRPYGEVIASPHEISHTTSDLSALTGNIQSFDEEVRVVMEATGAYHLPVLISLYKAGIFVSVVNPLVMKRYASTALRKGKTDKLDSVRIANYGIEHWFSLKQYQPLDKTYEELRILGRQYAHYITMKVESTLALSSILDRTMPGIKHLLSGKRSDFPTKDKLSDFVEEYWHFDNIGKMSEEDFITDYQRWAKEKGYHPSQAKATALYRMACNSIPTLPPSSPSTKMLTLEAVRILREVNRTLQTILTQMQAIATALPEYEVVRAMPGAGDVLSCRLIAEIGDVRRFHSGSALVAYAGIDAPPFQSGSYTSTKRSISKRGSSLLRKTGYEVMKCLKTVKPKHDTAVYDFMLKKEAQGKPKKVAKIAALNKFLRIYYARVMEMHQSQYRL